MERNVNVTNEGLVESKEMRCLAMEDLPNNLSKSPVMEGLETIIPGIATTNNVIDFFDTIQQSILWHVSYGDNEVKEAGAQQVTYKEWQNLLETLKTKSDLVLSNSNESSNQSQNLLETLKGRSDLPLSNSNNFTNVELEVLKSLSTLTEEERQAIKFPARGTWLFTLEAICKLGMMMTDTPKAKEFRDKIISTLKVEVMKTESLEKWHKTTVDNMVKMVETNKSLNDTMGDFIDRLLDDTKFMYKRELLDIKHELEELLEIIKTRIANNQDNKYQVQISNRNIVGTAIREICDVIQELDNIIIGSVNQPGDYKREDILKSLYTQNEGETDGQYTIRCRKQAGVLNTILVEAGLITITEHKQTSKSGKTKILRKVTPNDKNPWVFDSIVGQFGKESQPTFHLTKYGYSLWTYLYTEAKKCLDSGLDGTHIEIDKEEFDAKYCFINK